MSSRICTRCAWRAWWSRRIALSSRICTRCAWRDLMNLNSSLVFVSVSFIIGFSWLIGGIGSGFIIIFSFINESLNPVITTLFGNDLLLSLFIILYSTSMLLFLWVTDSNSRFMCSGLETLACFSILCIVTSLDSKEPLFFISSKDVIFIYFVWRVTTSWNKKGGGL